MIKDNQKYNKLAEPNSAFLEELRQKMPEFFTAAKFDEDGNEVKPSTFDNEKFQEALRSNNINELSSGYRLEFIGKNYAKKQAGERPTTVIVPDNEHNKKEENKDSKNLFFTGDNLEVLRHLQQNYANSVDFIYIDPPYNTGSDGFVYPDKFDYSDDQLKDMFALSDEELGRLKSIQGKATHSAWLTFMYPRLYLSKKLLTDSGVIFVSIDDNEQANLKILMDEVFGEGSFISEVVWANKEGGGKSDSKFFKNKHEYIITYAKNIEKASINGLPVNNISRYTQEDEYKSSRGPYYLQKLGMGSIQYSSSLDYPIEAPDGTIIYPADNNNGRKATWRWSKSKLEWGFQQGYVVIKKDSSNIWTVYTKQYLKADNDGNLIERLAQPIALIEQFSTTQSNKQMQLLFDGESLFSYSKPVGLIQNLIRLGSNKNSLILDFFAGSSTTAEAVMQLNAEDGGKRQYIMCTLPEPTFTTNSDGTEIPTKGGTNAYNAGYRSIDEISRERIVRAAKKIQEEKQLLPNEQDFGFKHYRVVEPTQKALEQLDYDDILQEDLFDGMIEAFSSEKLGISGNARGLDTILATYLAKDNYKFDVDIEMVDFSGIQLPYVNNQRIYLISERWMSANTRALVNAIGKNEIVVQTIVVYGYTIAMERLRELEIALNQLENKVNLQVRY